MAGISSWRMAIDSVRQIQAPAAVVWRVLTDVTLWPRWGPSVSAVESADRHIISGSTGRIRTSLGIWLPFEVTHMVPGQSWRWRVGGVPATGHRVHAVDEVRCQLVFEIPAWAAPYALVCRVAAGRIARICADLPSRPDSELT
jgi:uncharacterized protein YndB with AHSA1/START domain